MDLVETAIRVEVIVNHNGYSGPARAVLRRDTISMAALRAVFRYFVEYIDSLTTYSTKRRQNYTAVVEWTTSEQSKRRNGSMPSSNVDSLARRLALAEEVPK